MKNARMTVKLAALALATGMTLLSTAASAQKSGSSTGGDGVITIDQTKATNGAVTPGDTAGFPVTISQGGTYRLTSNLTVPAALDAIVIAPGVDVVIDMNGFSIVGPATCSKSVNCSVSGGTVGVRLGDGATAALTRGKIRGFTTAGAYDSGGVSKAMLRVTEMEFSGNANGVYASRLMAHRVYADGNSQHGIGGSIGMIVDSIAMNSGHSGIVLQIGAVRGNTAYGNAYGYTLGTSVAYQDNSAAQNTVANVYGAGPTGSNNAF